MTERQLAGMLPAIRGSLAEPTGDDDNPYRAPLIGRRSGSEALDGGYPSLDLRALSDAGADAYREQTREAALQYANEHGRRPKVLRLPGGVCADVDDRPEPADLPLSGRVAIVTGAAGAIGHGICKAFLANGCRVALTDLASDRLDVMVAELEGAAEGRAIGVPLDVTDPESVSGGFARVVLEWGGLDIVVVNAGAAHVASLDELSLETFQRLERVNVEGGLLTIAEAGRLIRRQGIGGDIVLISTKNVFAPGARFGAYSATKAAVHQLARIASLELAEFGIRVNMVAPDAVFSDGQHRSGLWAQVGPDRMKARGLDEAGLEEYYRSRNLLKVRVQARHVANAVLFFVTHQTPTTGATIPVDGGLPDATPR